MANKNTYEQMTTEIAHIKREQKKLTKSLAEYERYSKLIQTDCIVSVFQKATHRSAKTIAFKSLILSALSKFNSPVSRSRVKDSGFIHHTGYTGIALKEISDQLLTLEKSGLVYSEKNKWALTDKGRSLIQPKDVCR